MSSVLIGMFDSQADAERARMDLVEGGFPESAISMTGDSSLASTTTSSSGSSGESSEHEGTIGRWLNNLFGSDDEAEPSRAGYTDTYKEAFRRGSYGVSVTAASDSELDMAERILSDAGAVDIDERSQQWRQEGWTGGSAAYMAGTSTDTATDLASGSSAKLQEVEEELKVGKRTVARGGVRVFSRMTEVPVQESVTLREEHADIQRRAVNRPATEADFAAFKEGSIEVRETAEEAVISKTARVVGEVIVGKTATEREETINDTVRKTTVDVEPIAGKTAKGDSQTAYVAGSGQSGSATTGSLNRDPLSGEPGAHPVGTGLGATAGGIAAGAAAGTVAGPVGTVVGAAVGAVAGGLAGKGVAEEVDPTVTEQGRKL